MSKQWIPKSVLLILFDFVWYYCCYVMTFWCTKLKLKIWECSKPGQIQITKCKKNKTKLIRPAFLDAIAPTPVSQCSGSVSDSFRFGDSHRISELCLFWYKYIRIFNRIHRFSDMNIFGYSFGSILIQIY